MEICINRLFLYLKKIRYSIATIHTILGGLSLLYSEYIQVSRYFNKLHIKIMKSKFNFRVYLIPFLIIVFFGLGIIVLVDALLKNDFENNKNQILQGILCIIAFGLIFLHEVKTKLTSITFTTNNIETTDWFKKKNIIKFNEINGFEIKTVKGKYENYEYLYILKNDKRVATISQTYHKNYSDLKSIVVENFKNLGVSKFGFLNEITEIITLSYL